MRIVLAAGLASALASLAQAQSMNPTHLRCEYLDNPIGIDVTAPRLSWWNESRVRGDVQTAYQIEVATSPDLLAKGKPDLWDTGKVESDKQIQIEYSGQGLRSRQGAFWRVRVWDKADKPSAFSGSAHWEMGLLNRADWQAQWIGLPGGDTADPGPAPFIRKDFTCEGTVSRARVYASAHGLYDLYVNGQRVSKDVFDPGFTDYKKRIQYQIFDVTNLVKKGRNAVGAVVGDGWYVGHVGWGGRQNYGKQPMGLVQLEVEYADGTIQTVASGDEWKVSVGPILSSDFMKGENYDARKEMAGWAKSGFNDSKWLKPASVELGEVPLEARNSEPVEPWRELHAHSIKQPNPGVFVYDLGQNMVGWARLKVSGPAGTKVELRFAEMLNPDGTIYTTNLRKATSTDTYTLKGQGEETYEPSFTFHGFRYVEVTGFPGTPTESAITGIVLGSATPDTGSFETSNKMVNQLWHNIYWGQRGNYLSIPTDCPQRDERLGWMGDAEVFVRTATYNCDIAAFMTKWTNDVQDGQSDEGAFSDVSPRIFTGDAAPAWGDAGVIVPWVTYEVYDDKRLLESHFESMKKWVDYIHEANPNLLWDNKRHNDYGDWLNIKADMPRDVLGTSYFAHSTDLVARAARALGKEDEAKTYSDLFDGIRQAYVKAYVSDDGRIKGDTQTCYLMALDFNLLPDNLRPLAVQHLVDNIVNKCDTHLSTGFLGVKLLNTVLTNTGHLDLAYELLEQTTFPSWFYPIENGATTIWERWDGWTKDKGFQDPGMNSFNHYSLGSVGEWLYSVVGGIEIATPGFKTFKIHPRPGGGLTFANCSYDSSYGKIVSNWKKQGKGISMEVVVPANTSAEIYVPSASRADVKGAEELQYLRMEDGAAVYRAGSGTYRLSG